MTLDNNTTIEGQGRINLDGNPYTLVNDGTLLANASSPLNVGGGNGLTNKGTFEAAAGSTLHTTGGTFTNFSGTTLTGGTYDANGTIEIDQLGNSGGEIVTNNANIVLDGLSGGAAAILDSASKNALSNLATNQSSFTVENGGSANFTTAGDLANSGTVTVGGGTTLTLGSGGTHNYTQSAGTTQGTGTIAGAVTINGGTVLPGATNAPGTLSIIGSYNQAGGTFGEQIASASNFSVLNVTGGGLTLGSGSLLNISLLSGFDPAGDSFTIMNDTGGLVSGTFSNAPATGFSIDGYNWTIAYNTNDIVLNATPSGPTTVDANWATGSPANWTNASDWACSPGSSTCVPSNGTPPNAVYDTNVDNTASGATMTLSTSETVDTLALTAGTLDIASGASLNLANQPNGITDIAAGAGLSLQGSFTAGSNSALAGLTSVEGSLLLDNGQTTSVTPGGSPATLTISSTGSLNVGGASTVLAVNGDISNSGAVTAQSGGAITTTGNYAQTSGTTTVNGRLSAASYTQSGGKTQINNGGTVSVTGLYSQSAGVTGVDGTLISPTVTLTGGTLQGTGLIEGSSTGGAATVSVTAGATIQPSDPMTISGTFTVDAASTFLEDITSATNFGALDVQGTPGTASIAGTLDINLIGGFTPLNGESFTILDAMGGLTGTFASITGDTSFGSGGTWLVAYSVDTVTLTATVPTSSTSTPEPASLLLFVSGLLALAWAARRRRMRAADNNV